MLKSTVVYGLDGNNLERLADSIAAATGIHLHSCHSPMDGPWYCSVSPAEVKSCLVDPAAFQALSQRPQLTLRSNDPGDAYYGGQLYPDKGRFLLDVEAEAPTVERIDRNLTDSGLSFVRIQVGHA